MSPPSRNRSPQNVAPDRTTTRRSVLAVSSPVSTARPSNIGEAATVGFAAFLKVWRELPHPRAIVNDPENASTVMTLRGVLYKLASDINSPRIS